MSYLKEEVLKVLSKTHSYLAKVKGTKKLIYDENKILFWLWYCTLDIYILYLNRREFLKKYWTFERLKVKIKVSEFFFESPFHILLYIILYSFRYFLYIILLHYSFICDCLLLINYCITYCNFLMVNKQLHSRHLFEFDKKQKLLYHIELANWFCCCS